VSATTPTAGGTAAGRMQTDLNGLLADPRPEFRAGLRAAVRRTLVLLEDPEVTAVSFALFTATLRPRTPAYARAVSSYFELASTFLVESHAAEAGDR
jgi:hypothetical protein